MSQVEVRLVGPTREALEAALAHLQKTAGIQVQRGPRWGRKGDWLAYATVSVTIREPAAEEAESESDRGIE